MATQDTTDLDETHVFDPTDYEDDPFAGEEIPDFQNMTELSELYNKFDEIEKAHSAIAGAARGKKKILEGQAARLMHTIGVPAVKVGGRNWSVTKQKVYNAKDWSAIYHYMVSEDRPHLLKKALSNTAVLEEVMSRGGEPIPGVEEAEIEVFAVRKAK